MNPKVAHQRTAPESTWLWLPNALPHLIAGPHCLKLAADTVRTTASFVGQPRDPRRANAVNGVTRDLVKWFIPTSIIDDE